METRFGTFMFHSSSSVRLSAWSFSLTVESILTKFGGLFPLEVATSSFKLPKYSVFVFGKLCISNVFVEKGLV